MRNEKYRKELLLTKEDFISSKYMEILSEAKKDGYDSYWDILSKKAKEASNKTEEKTSKVLWLLAELCSISIEPSNIQEPYKPKVVWANGTRSVIPDDFTYEDREFFEKIFDLCENYILKARLADILWTWFRDFKYLKSAIECYMKFSLLQEDFSNEPLIAFERAIRLSIISKQPLNDIEQIILDNFQQGTSDDLYYCNRINKLLIICQLEEDNINKVIEKLKQLSNELFKNNDYRASRTYLQSIREWYKKLGRNDDIYSISRQIADIYVAEGDSRIDSNMISSNFYENALEEYRSIPKHYREKHFLNERMDDVYRMMEHANKMTLGEMHSISTDSIDITKIVNRSIEMVSNCEFEKAMLKLANISTSPHKESLDKSAKEFMDKSVFQIICSTVHYSHDGRVIGKSTGTDLLDKSSNTYVTNLEHATFQQYSIEIGLIVKGCIYPALYKVIEEHQIRKQDIYDICLNSSIIPRDRLELWVEGIFQGFELNFAIAIHMLVPQIEDIVRKILKDNGEKTTTFKDGIETENGLSNLLGNKNICKFIDSNMLFELKYLFANLAGFNFRNDIAHGLLKYNSFQSHGAIYLWWFCFKLVINYSHLDSVK